jgi:hypothetical protein
MEAQKVSKRLLRVYLVIFASYLVMSGAAQSQTFHNIGYMGEEGASNIGMSFMTSETNYETEAGSLFDLDRKLFGVDVGLNMGDDLAVFGTVGRIISTELVDYRDFKGEGFQFGFGAKTAAYKGEKAHIVPYGQFSYLNEEMTYKASDAAATKIKADGDAYEFIVGAIFKLVSNPRFSPYFGFELFPLNKGEIKFKEDVTAVGTGSTAIAADARTIEYKRDDVLNIKFGASALFGNFSLRGEAIMISETTFLFGTSFLF